MAGWRSKADERRDAWLDENVPPELHTLVRAGGAYLAALRLLHAVHKACERLTSELASLDGEAAADLLDRNHYLADQHLFARLERLVCRAAQTYQAEQARRRAERPNE